MVRWKQGSKWGRQAAVAFNFRVYLTYGWEGKGAQLNVMSAQLRECDSDKGGRGKNPDKFSYVNGPIGP